MRVEREANKWKSTEKLRYANILGSSYEKYLRKVNSFYGSNFDRNK